MSFFYNCIGRCLFTKSKEKVTPSLLRKLSYTNSQTPSSPPSHKNMDYNESIAYQLA